MKSAKVSPIVFSQIVNNKVDIELWDHRSTPQVFWDMADRRCNSYVVVKSERSSLYAAIYAPDGTRVEIVSINGAGEIRWTIVDEFDILREGQGKEAAEYWGIQTSPWSSLYPANDKRGACVSSAVTGCMRNPAKVFTDSEGSFWALVQSEAGWFTRDEKRCVLVNVDEKSHVQDTVCGAYSLTNGAQEAAEFFDLGDVEEASNEDTETAPEVAYIPKQHVSVWSNGLCVKPFSHTRKRYLPPLTLSLFLLSNRKARWLLFGLSGRMRRDIFSRALV